jgi:putative spermidine/putrescine transport system ATP-binding protein
MTIAVRFENVSRHFGDVHAVDDVTFDILDGEFFTMLGPSGSGKTTCLRMVAGFDQPTAGRILMHEQDVSNKPPYERDVNTVFQDYALFPHMNVGDNIAYGLMIRKIPKPERVQRVREMLDLVQLGGYELRKPSQLSGGQRQRVALARALINNPHVLLLDEPLGALDLKLRQQMQTELKAIQKKVGITFIFVTHDQEEALTMSDRIAVFNRGKVEQIGAPEDMYERPATAFVAGFLGTTNLLSGDAARALTGSPDAIAIRPEKIRLMGLGQVVPDGWLSVRGIVRDMVYLGMYKRYVVGLPSEGDIVVIEQNLDANAFVRGAQVTLAWRSEHMRKLS